MTGNGRTYAMPDVRKLTAGSKRRRKHVTCRRHAIAYLLLAVTALPSAYGQVNRSEQAGAPEWQAVEEIAATAEAFLRSKTGVFAGNTEVRAGPLDPRHRLARCDEAPQAFLRRGAEIQARTIVGVRCIGARPWKVYVPVDVIVTAPVLVARQTLMKGHVLTAADLAVENRDVTKLRSGYHSKLSLVVGQRLKTQLIAGKILKSSMTAADEVIRRGQSVMLVVRSEEFTIRMAGTALMHGAVDQRIRVQNNNSGRTVEGIVRSREQVEVLLPENHPFFHARSKVSPPLADTGLSNNDR